ncbi:hypothetical protein [Allosphingosinicella deserti]|nr:hypothetical protein [Sphingomonas deserti]
MDAYLEDLQTRTRLSSILRQVGARLRGAMPSEQARQEPGILQNLAGWLRWHSPFGNSIQRQFGERVSHVDRLIASGNIDAALKLALRLGAQKAGAKPPSRFPAQLPRARATLDFDVAPTLHSAPILGDGTFYHVRQRYLELARRLEKEGDWRRAAYIHSQLLADNREAVLVLERGEQYAEAAKLALGARLQPALTIRMLFKDGQRDAALALARRTGCFEQLAEDSRGKDATYHAYVVKAWTDMLVSTGQILRALQVTDALAREAGTGEALLPVRQRWLAAAVAAEEPTELGGELLARALFAASWRDEGIDIRMLDTFPFIPVSSDGGPFAKALASLQHLARGEAEDAAERLIALIADFMRIGAPDAIEQKSFWRGAAPRLIEPLARSIFEHASARLKPADLKSLQALLRIAGLPVLAADVMKLTKLHQAISAPALSWRVPPPSVIRPAIRSACLLATGTMLIWRESDVLELLDRYGASLWRQSVSGIVGLVPIGASPNVILIQRQPDGSALLTRLASHRRTLHPIGSVALAAHHDVTSESQWLVQIGGEIGAIDLVKMCAPAPQIEFLWSCALTDRLQARGFAHQAGGCSWITQDMSAERFGITEIWTFRPSGELVASLCLPGSSSGDESGPHATEWFWDSNAERGRLGSVDSGRWMRVVPWSEDGEDQARALASARRKAGLEVRYDVQPCDFARSFVRIAKAQPGEADGPSQIDILAPCSGKPLITLVQDDGAPLTCLFRAADSDSGSARANSTQRASTLLFGDEAGRLFIVRPHERRVSVI